MNISKNFFFLTALIALFFTSFATSANAQIQTRGGGSSTSSSRDIIVSRDDKDKEGKPSQENIVFSAADVDEWDAATYLRIRGIDGESFIAVHKKTGVKIMALIRGGKIAAIGEKSPTGAFKILQPNASPCFRPLCATYQIVHCYTLDNGECICVCSSNKTMYP